jgi:hypothetical protein
MVLLWHLPPRDALTVRERSGALERRGATVSTEFAPKSAVGKFQPGLTRKARRMKPTRSDGRLVVGVRPVARPEPLLTVDGAHIGS